MIKSPLGILLKLSAVFIFMVNTAFSVSADDVTQGAVQSFTLTTGDAGWSYHWVLIKPDASGETLVSTGLSSGDIIFSDQGTYTLRVQATDDYGCLSEWVERTINVLPPAPVSGGDQIVCYSSTTPAVTVTVGPDETADWYDSASGGTLLKSGTTSYISSETAVGSYTYYAEARNTATGFRSTTRMAVTLTIKAVPAIALASSANPTSCSGNDGSMTLNFANVPDGTYSVSYDGGSFTGVAVASGTATISGLTSGTYSNLSITVNGCTSTDDVGVSLSDPDGPTAAYITGTTTICAGSNANLTVTITGGTSPYTVTLSDGTTVTGYNSGDDISVSPVTTTSYTITSVTDTNGCTSGSYTGTATVTVDQSPVGGTIAGGGTVVSGTNSTTLTLLGYTGTIDKWQQSTDGGNWTDITNSTNTYTVTSLTRTTMYRAILTNGVCPPVYSGAATISVGANQSPIALDDAASTTETKSATGNMLMNDSDPEGSTLTVVSVEGITTAMTDVVGTYGTLDWSTDGSFVYVPNSALDSLDINESVTDEFNYIIKDAAGNQATAKITITINGKLNTISVEVTSFCNNDLPYVSYVVTPNFTVASNSLSVSWIDSQSNVVIQDSGLPLTGDLLWPGAEEDQAGNAVDWPGWVYTGGRWVEGSDGFEYTIPQATIEFSVNPAQSYTVTYPLVTAGCAPVPPFVAVDDSDNTTEDQPITIPVLDNDSGISSGAAVTVTAATSDNGGILVVNTDGTITYTPATDYAGTDRFTYQVCDTTTVPRCDQADVTVTVAVSNTAPVAVNDINNTIVNTAVSGNVLTNDYDVDGDILGVITSLYSIPSNGTVTMESDGSYTYTPNQDFEGEDFFMYVVCEVGTAPVLCDTAVVTIEVIPVAEGNNAPVANEDEAQTIINTPVSGNVLLNDFDPDLDNFFISRISSNVKNGSLSFNKDDGTFIYTPNNDFEGTDQFIYEICDDGNPSLCSQATVTITTEEPEKGNNTPFAADDVIYTTGNPAEGDVSKNDSDPDGDNLTYTLLSNPSKGTVAMNNDGTCIYTPDSGTKDGPDQFIYEVCDDGDPSKCSKATVYVILIINSITGDRLATNDINTTIQNQSVDGNVLTNDDDYANANSAVTLYTGPSHGTVELKTDGDYTYTPELDFIGKDNFYYIVCTNDPPADCDTVNVTVTVIADEIQNGPVANDDETETTINTPVTSNLLANDYSPSGESMVLNEEPLTGPSHGTVAINSDGQYTYTPEYGFTGTDQFTYEVCGLVTDVCATATVTIVVDDAEDNRIFAADDAVFTYGEAVSGNVLTNDIYPGTVTLRVNRTPLVSPSHGTVVLNADGTFTYTPEKGFEGVDYFVYEICDSDLGVCDDATVTITVLPAPDQYADLEITKTATPVLRINEEITYELKVTNLGNSKAVNVRIGDYMPFYIQSPVYTTGSSSIASDWTGMLKIGDLDANQSVTIIIKGIVGENASNTIVNYASAGSDTWDPDFNNNISVAKTVVNRSPLIVITNGTTITLGCCNTDGVTIDASQTTGATTLSYRWSPSIYLDDPTSATPHFTPGEDTEYTLTVTDENGLSSTETVRVQIADCPDAVTDQYLFVETASTTIVADGSESTGEGISYRWWTYDGIILNGETNSTAQISGLGKYYLEVTDSYGCSDVDSLIVGVYIQAINDTAETNLNTSVDINVATNDIPQGLLDPSSITITTFPSHGTAMVMADSLITYTPNQYYAGTDNFIYKICDYFMNCDEATVLVIINDQELFIPDAFSPNGDGVNDYFEIQGISKYNRVQIEIINRWGNVVYRSQNYGIGEGRDGYWDGTANTGVRVGHGDVPSGTYFYIMKFDNGEKVSGSVYLDR